MISDGDCFRIFPWFRAARDGEAYLFEYGGRLVRITGDAPVPLLSVLLPLLDGSRTVTDVEHHLSEWEPGVIRQALSVLMSSGVITQTGTIIRDAGGDEQLLTAIMGPQQAGKPIAETRIGMIGDGALARSVGALVREAGAGHVTAWKADDVISSALDLVIAAADGTDLPHLEAWNGAMLERNQPWLLVVPFDGVYGAVGPLFIPPETACYACLRTRRRSVLEDPGLAELYDEYPVHHPMGAAVTSLMAGLTVHLALRWITRRDPSIPGILYTVGLLPRPSVTAHEVFPVPRCAACRPAAQHVPAPWDPGRQPARNDR